MVEYCEICGDELDEEDELEGICKKCQKSKDNPEYEKDEEFIDPGIT